MGLAALRFRRGLQHEVKVTGLIYNLVNIAAEEKDHATSNFLQWFITEQVEEETSADEHRAETEADRRRRRGSLSIGSGTRAKSFHPAAWNDNPGRRRPRRGVIRSTDTSRISRTRRRF